MNGELIERVPNPRPGKRLAESRRRVQRRLSRQRHRAKVPGVRLSSRQYKRQPRLSKLCAREAKVRADATHRFTTGIAREFETVVFEDLNASGMAIDHSLAGAVLDEMYEIQRTLA